MYSAFELNSKPAEFSESPQLNNIFLNPVLVVPEGDYEEFSAVLLSNELGWFWFEPFGQFSRLFLFDEGEE
ncbi:hypothetical protein J2747_000546 [Thermococcus stetteri]|nr:hypothetical protein [Thermococcus stetteri]